MIIHADMSFIGMKISIHLREILGIGIYGHLRSNNQILSPHSFRCDYLPVNKALLSNVFIGACNAFSSPCEFGLI